jgi:hypothetical protein
MFTRTALAMVLSASAVGASTLPASARDTGQYGDWRTACGQFMESNPAASHGQQRPLLRARPTGSVFWDKKDYRGPAPFAAGWHFSLNRCAWFGFF